MILKVLSWNIWVDSHFDQVKDFLHKSDADIIGLQEVREDDSSRETIKFLEKFGFKHEFAPMAKNWGGKAWNDGPAIFTKHQIVSTGKFILPDNRALVRADINIDGKLIHAFSTHLTHTHQKASEIQLQQIEELLKHVSGSASILMGDFNAVPESQTIQRAKELLLDSDSKSQPTWSVYPEGCVTCNPQKIDTRLDYIFTTKDIKTKSYKVEKSKGSDHLPVSAILVL